MSRKGNCWDNAVAESFFRPTCAASATGPCRCGFSFNRPMPLLFSASRCMPLAAFTHLYKTVQTLYPHLKRFMLFSCHKPHSCAQHAASDAWADAGHPERGRRVGRRRRYRPAVLPADRRIRPSTGHVRHLRPQEPGGVNKEAAASAVESGVTAYPAPGWLIPCPFPPRPPGPPCASAAAETMLVWLTKSTPIARIVMTENTRNKFLIVMVDLLF